MSEQFKSTQRKIAVQMAMDDEELKTRFAGLTTHQVGQVADLAGAFLSLAITVRALTPASREQQLIFTKLEEAQSWAELAIARNPAGAANPKPY